MWRILFLVISFTIFAAAGALYVYDAIIVSEALFFLIPLFILGVYDMFQKRSNVLRNYPLVGHLRFLLMGIRPEIQQYFVETNQSGMPFSNEIRDLIYQRAAGVQDTIPFGTQRDVYAVGYEWINHSILPKVLSTSEQRIIVGGPGCTQPYNASRLNISGMSFGALSGRAIMALNLGAKRGGFAQNTGEGGLSTYHLAEGGDLIWQIGTAYFGCRTANGEFDPDAFAMKSQLAIVKMIEIKLSQGAKPAHGGVLPKAKISAEIAKVRGIPMGEDCVSPSHHSMFSTPIDLLKFIQQLRDLSGGKPVGFKLCVGSEVEFMCICKAMLKTGIFPDFITVDGGEGGTGASPVEFTDFMGTPLNEALSFVHNCLVGINVRKDIRIIASGKMSNGFQMIRAAALGADMFNAARPMMFALGCIQSRSCNTNKCPTGITTQDPLRAYAISVKDKAPKVESFHHQTMKSFLEVLGASGIEKISDLHPERIYRRVSEFEFKSYAEIYDFCKPASFIHEVASAKYLKWWGLASAEHFKREGENIDN